jgi:NAD(P)-dependent dehydrogenase (short-subunit alcohol dehydrogenase family)
VVVITGASSGIGRCAAQLLAARGARVVLTARNDPVLKSLAREIEERGGHALAVPGDVTREADLQRVVRAALDRYGRIDTWVNNAAVFVQGRVEDISLEEYRRVLEVNLLGYINGTRAVLGVFRNQGKGHVIHVSSVLGKHGAAYFSAYAAAKAGIDGFTQALRAELFNSRIRVSTLYLPPVDTPIYRHARGKFGTVPRPPPPVASPESVARNIAKLAVRPDRERVSGFFGAFFLFLGVLPKGMSDWALNRTAAFTRTDEPAGEDNFYAPVDDPPRVHDGWMRPGWRGLTPRVVVRALPWESVVGAAGLGFAAGRLYGR